MIRREDDKTVVVPTMDSISYFQMLAANAGQGQLYAPHWYKATEIPVLRPSECPCCDRTMAYDLIPVMSLNNIDRTSCESGDACEVVSVYRCTSCNHMFAIWTHHEKLTAEEYSCDIIDQFPHSTGVTEFSENIQKLSREFVKIYNQAENAEHQGLDEICGMGYRRSAEFLVDAYVRHKKPDTDIAASLPLAKKIQDYVPEEKIRELAKKTAWLGNDETHIEKKHPNRDISDMKKFIRAMVALIDADFAYEDACSIE